MAAANIKRAWAPGERFCAYAFEVACALHYIDHRLAKPNRPWASGQVERMNRTLKEANVHTYYNGHAQLREHLAAFPVACYQGLNLALVIDAEHHGILRWGIRKCFKLTKRHAKKAR